MVKRYDLSVDDWNEVKLLEEDGGEFVRYADYEVLEKQKEELEKFVKQYRRKLGIQIK